MIEERGLAKAVAQEMVRDLLLQYDVFDWKEEFFSGGRPYQDQIPALTDPNCHVTICIFGERIGERVDGPMAELTKSGRIPAHFNKWPLTLDPSECDRIPLTGSVWEYLEACEADAAGTGRLLVFFKGASTIFERSKARARPFGGRRYLRQQIAGLDEGSADYERVRQSYFQQTDWLELFLDEITERQLPVNRFESTAEFKTSLTRLLRDALHLNREAVSRRQLFKGLESFAPRDHDAFFGRETDTRNVNELLTAAEADPKKVPLLVLKGRSGAGKSSLAKAGVAGGLALKARTPARRFAAVNADIDKLTGKPIARRISRGWLAQIGLIFSRAKPFTEIASRPPIVQLGRRIALAARLPALKRELERHEHLNSVNFVKIIEDNLAQAARKTKQRIVPVIVLDQFEDVLRDERRREFKENWLPVAEAVVALARKKLAWVIIPLPAEHAPNDRRSWPLRLEELKPFADLRSSGLSPVEYELDFPQTINERLAIIKGPFQAIQRPLDDELVKRILDEAREFGANSELAVLPLISALQRWIVDHCDAHGVGTRALRTSAAAGNAEPPAADDRTISALDDDRDAALIKAEDLGAHLTLSRVIDQLGNAALVAFERGEDTATVGGEQAPISANTEAVLSRLLKELVTIMLPREPHEELSARDIKVEWAGITDFSAGSRLSEDGVRLALLLKDTRILAQVRTDSVRLMHPNVLWHWQPATRWLKRRERQLRLMPKVEALELGRQVTLSPDTVAEIEIVLGGFSGEDSELHDRLVGALARHFAGITDPLLSNARLHAAIDIGNAALVTAYLQVAKAGGAQRFDPNAVGIGGATPIVRLADAGMIEHVIPMLDLGADPAHQADREWTIVHALTSRGEHVALQAVLGRIPDRQRNILLEAPARRRNGSRPLHLAALGQSADTARVLLRVGANRLSQTLGGSMPLHLSISSRNADVTKLLLTESQHVQLAHVNAAGQTPLMIAAETGDARAVTMFLNQDGDPLRKDASGQTAMHAAAARGYSDVIVPFMKRLEQQSLAQPVDGKGMTPLHLAAERGHAAAVETLIRCGAPCDPSDAEGVTPLILACRAGHADIAALLMSAKPDGADPMMRSIIRPGSLESAYTPLREAVRRGHHALVERILAHIPPKRHKQALDAADALKLTPLHHAVHFGYLEAIEALLAAGATPDAANNARFTPLHIAAMVGDADAAAMLIHRVPANQQTDQGRTPLHWAARNGHASVIEVLAEQDGISGEVVNMFGQTPLHLAAYYGHADAVRALLDSGLSTSSIDWRDGAKHFGLVEDTQGEEVDRRPGDALSPIRHVEGDANLEDNPPFDAADQLPAAEVWISHKLTTRGRTALYSATRSGSIECVALLLDRGANGSVGDVDGLTPIHIAATQADVGMLRVFLNGLSGAQQIDLRDTRGRTPLHYAASVGSGETVALLLDRGADPRAASLDTYEPLHRACQKDNLSAAVALLARLPPSALLDKVDWGETSLHVAARSGSVEVIRALVSKLPQLVFETDKKRATALHIAALCGRASVNWEQAAAGVDISAEIKRRSAAAGDGAFKKHLARVEALLDLGIDANVADASQATPMHGAAFYNHADVVALLIERGGDPTIEHYRHLSPPHVAALAGSTDALAEVLQRVPVDRLRRIRNASLLHTAAAFGNAAAVKFLLKWRGPAGERFDPNEQTADQRTPLHLAAFNQGAEAGACIELLLKAKADPTIVDNAGDLPVHCAAMRGSPGAFALLMRRAPQSGAALNQNGKSPLHLAIEGRFALEVYRSVDGRERQRLVSRSDPAIIEAIEKLPVPFKVLDASGEAPIHVAVRRVADGGHQHDASERQLRKRVLAMLAARPGAASARSAKGCTALHLAAELGSEDAVAVLLRGGSAHTLLSMDKQGFTAQQIALKGGFETVARMLAPPEPITQSAEPKAGMQT